MLKKVRYLLLLLLIPCSLRAQDLWERGMDWYRESEAWKPSGMTSLFLLRDGNGREEERVEEVYRLSYGDGKSFSYVVSSLRNGVDQTEKRRSEAERESRNRGPGPGFLMGGGDHPLNPDLQGRVSRTETGSVRVEGVDCREYSFALELEKGTMTGTLALAAASGEPVLMSWTFDPLPPFMSELSFRSRYERAPFGVAVLSSVEFSGTGGILFLRKEIFGTLSLSAYGRD